MNGDNNGLPEDMMGAKEPGFEYRNNVGSAQNAGQNSRLKQQTRLMQRTQRHGREWQQTSGT